MRGRRRLVAVALVLAMPGAGDSSVVRRPAPVGKITEAKGLTLRLGEAQGDAQPAPAASPATKGEPLSAADTARVLARLPELPPAPGDEKDFALREKSLPPPRTGTTVKDAFPPPPTDAAPPADSSTGPLTVVRRLPEGEVPQAPQLSVTFSQPMVAVTAHDDLAASAVPVRLDPQPPGQWRWVGTKTLLFEPTVRFPMATEFRVEVPAGTRSATGGTLAARGSLDVRDAAARARAAVSRGPADAAPAGDLRVVRPAHRPGGAARLRDDRRSVRARADGDARGGRGRRGGPPSVRPGDGRPVARVRAQGAAAAGRRRHRGDRRRRALRGGPAPDREAAGLELPHLRRAQGRRAPLRLERPVSAGDAVADPVLEPARRDRVPPRDGARGARRAGLQGRRQRAVDERAHRVQGAHHLQAHAGRRAARRVRADARRAADARRSRWGRRSRPCTGKTGLVVLDPAAGPRLSVYSTNYAALKVRAYAVGPSDWPAFTAFMQTIYRERGTTPPGRLALSETVRVQGVADELAETRVDLAKALPNGLGHAIVMVEPAQPPPGPRQARAGHRLGAGDADRPRRVRRRRAGRRPGPPRCATGRRSRTSR